MEKASLPLSLGGIARENRESGEEERDGCEEGSQFPRMSS